jgi:nicotinic acid mononucleotide adenylyltransferase/nicotinamide mononucleotide (NMN) deamidase PncC
MWQERLKEAGVSVHVIATGAGAGFQQKLWEVCGSSAYLSGATFPYSAEEQEELLGFMPEHFCSEEAAIDLASAAYMKAYKFGGKKPVGIGLTASVASEHEHRGEHRVFCCIITDETVTTHHYTLAKGVGDLRRKWDGQICDDLAFYMLSDTLGLNNKFFILSGKNATELAKERFFARPFFTANGKRLAQIPHVQDFYDPYALMPGAFNPPHEGHFGIVDHMIKDYGKVTVFEVTAVPPHKEALSVQQLLQRAKLLQGYDRVFTRHEPFYIDKARAFPGMPLIMGADAMVRLLDPKWGLDIDDMFQEFRQLHTKLYIGSREIDGKMVTREDIQESLPSDLAARFHYLSYPIKGEWHISSTELRNKQQNKGNS